MVTFVIEGLPRFPRITFLAGDKADPDMVIGSSIVPGPGERWTFNLQALLNQAWWYTQNSEDIGHPVSIEDVKTAILVAHDALIDAGLI